MNKYIILAVIGIIVFGFIYLYRGGSTGTALGPGCLNSAWVNTSSSVLTTTTQILTAVQNNCSAYVWNDGVNDIYCRIEQKTAASSTADTTNGIQIPRKPSATSTIAGGPVVFGPDGIDARGNNVNCTAKNFATPVTILRK